MRGLLDGFILQSFLEATDPGTSLRVNVAITPVSGY